MPSARAVLHPHRNPSMKTPTPGANVTVFLRGDLLPQRASRAS